MSDLDLSRVLDPIETANGLPNAHYTSEAVFETEREVLWFQSVERGCYLADEDKPLVGLQNMRAGKSRPLEEQYACSFFYGLSAAATTTEEVVFSGGLNGVLRAYDVASGEQLWETKTAQPFETLNGVKGHGGAIDVDGQVLAGDWLYVQSGYSMFGQLPGNVILAFRLPESQEQ